jgi:hypothetical protein
MAGFLAGDVAGAIDRFDVVARTFEEVGNLLRVVTPRSTRGHALAFADRPVDGLRDFDAALELARGLGHIEGQAYALWHRSEILVALGRVDDARATANEADRLARTLGHRGWTVTAQRALGLAAAAAGDHQTAIAALEAGCRRVDPSGSSTPGVPRASRRCSSPGVTSPAPARSSTRPSTMGRPSPGTKPGASPRTSRWRWRAAMPERSCTTRGAVPSPAGISRPPATCRTSWSCSRGEGRDMVRELTLRTVPVSAPLRLSAGDEEAWWDQPPGHRRGRGIGCTWEGRWCRRSCASCWPRTAT